MKKFGFLGTIMGLVLIAMISIGSYNGMVSQRNIVYQTQSQLANMQDRQFKLIPNMVETVKGYDAHEAEVLEKVAQARAGLPAMANMDPSKISNADFQKQVVEAQAQISKALVDLRAVSERYPDLKANTNFQNLMVELEGSQNRVSVARTQEQRAIMVFNTTIQSFPRNIFANLFGFQPFTFFSVSDTVADGPHVKF